MMKRGTSTMTWWDAGIGASLICVVIVLGTGIGSRRLVVRVVVVVVVVVVVAAVAAAAVVVANRKQFCMLAIT